MVGCIPHAILCGMGYGVLQPIPHDQVVWSFAMWYGFSKSQITWSCDHVVWILHSMWSCDHVVWILHDLIGRWPCGMDFQKSIPHGWHYFCEWSCWCIHTQKQNSPGLHSIVWCIFTGEITWIDQNLDNHGINRKPNGWVVHGVIPHSFGSDPYHPRPAVSGDMGLIQTRVVWPHTPPNH